MILNETKTSLYCSMWIFLDWVNENKTLQDEDNLKWKDNGWKQINMLKDYKLCNGADVVLTQYQKCRTLPRSPNGKRCLYFREELYYPHINLLCSLMDSCPLDNHSTFSYFYIWWHLILGFNYSVKTGRLLLNGNKLNRSKKKNV